MSIDRTVNQLRNRRTRIIATVGPACATLQAITRMVELGVNVFRLNLGHGDHDTHRNHFNQVRQAALDTGATVAVLADLAGPKIRVGSFEGGQITLSGGMPVVVTTRDVPGEHGLIPSQYRALAKDLKAGNRILLDDGLLELKVNSVAGTEIQCTVIHGGVLSDRKGMNLPGVTVSAPSLTDRDRDDARFALELGVDFLALSFVRRGSDVEQLRSLVATMAHQAAIVAKIEKPEALDDIDAIMEAADAIMIARGDLGVELPPEQVPVAQDLLIGHARRHSRPVIVATQMLESMLNNPRPTRAEVADVSHTVGSGADAVMLSAETARGNYPLAAVQMMDGIARQTEGYLDRTGAFESLARVDSKQHPIPVRIALAQSTAQLSRDLAVRAIVVITQRGTSGTIVASARPAVPVLTVSARGSTCRRMNLLWGVVPVKVEAADLDSAYELAREVVRSRGLADAGDSILLVRGFRKRADVNTPSITVLTV